MDARKGAFLVERTPDHFEPFRATNYKLDHGDLLLFHNNSTIIPELVVAYARGQWLTFYFDEDYEWGQ